MRRRAAHTGNGKAARTAILIAAALRRDDEFLFAATAQNLRKLANLVPKASSKRPPAEAPELRAAGAAALLTAVNFFCRAMVYRRAMPREYSVLMWADACALVDRAEHLHRAFFRPSRLAAWEPPADMLETERELWIIVALPGVGADQLELAVADGIVTVAGERRLPVERRAVIHRLEIPHGRFERRITLPPGRYELERRELADGCLLLGLRKLR